MLYLTASLFFIEKTIMSHSAIIFTYLLVTMLNLWACYIQNENLNFYSKPLLMPLLSLWFYLKTKEHPSLFRNLILGVLFFSWGGDVLLLFVQTQGEHFFLMGLLSFLMTHLLYATAFFKIVSLKKGFLQKRKWIVIPFLFFYSAFNYYLLPDVATDMQAPILIYSSVIILMVLAALNWKDSVAALVFQFVFTGAVAFMLSDMIIALDKFKAPILNAGVWIMVLYLFGQYRIVKGCQYFITNDLQNEKNTNVI